MGINGQMRVLGSAQQLAMVSDGLGIEVQGGHTTVTWKTKAEQEQAEAFLRRLLESKYIVFNRAPANSGATKTRGGEGVRVLEPTIGPKDDLMVIPPMAGGE